MTQHTSGEAVVVSIWVLASLAIVAVACRVYARFWLVRNGGIDDWTIVVSLAFTIGMTVAITSQVHYGLGRRTSDLAKVNTDNVLKSLWVAIWCYHLAIGFVRLSIILQCMRIFPQADFRRTRWLVLYAMIAANTALQIWAFFSTVFFCSPIDAYWKTMMSSQYCLNRKLVWLSNSSVGMVLDIAVAVMPLPWIKQLRLPPRQKYMLMGVFVLAGLPCLLAVIRVQSLIQVATSRDPSYDNATLAIFSANEVYMGIVCACLPTLKTFFSRLTPRVADTVPATKIRNMASWFRRLNPRSRREDTVHLTTVGKDDRSTSKSALIGRSNSSQQSAWGVYVERVVKQEFEVAKPAKAAQGSRRSQADSFWQLSQWEKEAGLYGMRSITNTTSNISASHDRGPSQAAVSSVSSVSTESGSRERSRSRERISRES